MQCHSLIRRPTQLSLLPGDSQFVLYKSIRDHKGPIDKKVIDAAYRSSPNKEAFIDEVSNLLTQGSKYLLDNLTRNTSLKRTTILHMLNLLLEAYTRKALTKRSDKERANDERSVRFWISFQKTIREIFEHAAEEHAPYEKILELAEATEQKLKKTAGLNECDINRFLDVARLQSDIQKCPSPLALSLWLAEKIAEIKEEYPSIRDILVFKD